MSLSQNDIDDIVYDLEEVTKQLQLLDHLIEFPGRHHGWGHEQDYVKYLTKMRDKELRYRKYLQSLLNAESP